MFYRLEETRLKQFRTNTSAADAHYVAVGSPGPPEGKLWAVHAAIYYPSAAETRIVCASKYNAAYGEWFTILNPVSLKLDSSIMLTATFIEQGMEYLLFPGEFIYWGREDHTAGSTMKAVIEFTEIDLPLYTYDDPQVVKRQVRALSSIREQLGGAISRGSITIPPGSRGGRTGPLEK